MENSLFDVIESYKVMCKLSNKKHSFSQISYGYSVNFYKSIENTDIHTNYAHLTLYEINKRYNVNMTLIRSDLFDILNYFKDIEESEISVQKYKLKNLTLDEIKFLIAQIDKRC